MLKKIRILSVLLMTAMSANTFAGSSTIKGTVCQAVLPSNVHTTINRVLSKLGVKNQAVYGFFNKVFYHKQMVEIDRQVKMNCNK